MLTRFSPGVSPGVSPRGGRRAGWSAAALAAGVVTLVVLFVGTGGVGQDWQRHWDEDALVGKFHWSIEHGGTLLPGSYDWPSASYDATVLAFVPELFTLSAGDRSVSAFGEQLHTAADSSAFRLRLRRTFLAITSLGIVWIAAALGAAGYGPFVALTGAALIGTSWTIAYHGRWATPDGEMMQFAALALAGLAASLASAGRRWATWLAAAAAGAVVASKYSGWPLVVCLMASAALASASPRAGWRIAVKIGAIAVATFLIVTPGALLQPFLFLGGLRYQLSHYASGHLMHTIAPGLPHVRTELEAVLLHLWSRSTLVSAAVSLFAIPGALHLWRQSRPLAVTVVGFPVSYLLYLGVQRVYFARNLLVVAPFLAFLIAVGVFACRMATRRMLPRLILAAFVVLVVADNALVLVRAAASRRDPSRVVVLQQAARDVSREGEPVCITPAVRHDFAAAGIALPAQVQPACDGVAHVLFNRFEMRRYTAPGTVWFERVYGPMEIDYREYPDWGGYNPLVLATPEQARVIGVPMP